MNFKREEIIIVTNERGYLYLGDKDDAKRERV